MWYLFVAGATLHRHGTRSEISLISFRPKSTSASRAAARMWRIVLVEPPMATSRAMAFSKASLVAMARGSTEKSSFS